MMELPHNEEDRLAALERYGVLDTLPEREFDDLTLLASQICGTPITAVGLIDRNRQWFKSKIGFEGSEMPREQTFCTHAILNPNELMIVPDARLDSRFMHNPAVTSEMGVRFYAGAPLVTAAGEALGTLCVSDIKPRQLSEAQLEALRALARQVMAQMELKRQCVDLANSLAWRVQVEEALRESEARFRAFMDNSPIVATLKDEEGCYLYVNQPFLNRFGLKKEQVIGHDYFSLWPRLAPHLQEQDRRVLAGEKMDSTIEVMPMPDGSEHFWQTYRFALNRGGGSGRYIATVSIDITENKRYEQQLEAYQDKLQDALALVQAQSLRDSLTGLHNRRAFDRKLQEEFDRTKRYDAQISILMLDVDKFKSYNDTFGHGAGDELLKQLACLLQDKARSSDFVARYGGEEFVIILPNTGPEGAFVLAERFRRAVQDASWSQRNVTISIGVSSCIPSTSQAIQDTTALLKAADTALYLAKSNGRNRVEQAPA